MIERGGKSEKDREGNRLETAYVRNSLPYTEIEDKLFVFLSKRLLTEKKDTGFWRKDFCFVFYWEKVRGAPSVPKDLWPP